MIEINQRGDGRWGIVAISSGGARATIDIIDHDDPATLHKRAGEVLIAHVLRAGIYDRSNRAIILPGGGKPFIGERTAGGGA